MLSNHKGLHGETLKLADSITVIPLDPVLHRYKSAKGLYLALKITTSGVLTALKPLKLINLRTRKTRTKTTPLIPSRGRKGKQEGAWQQNDESFWGFLFFIFIIITWVF
jgi:hypothetical protein